MKSIIRRAFSRPIQMSCNAVTAISAYYLLPDHPSALQWTAYGFIWVSLLTFGLDSYNEGIATGIRVAEALHDKP